MVFCFNSSMLHNMQLKKITKSQIDQNNFPIVKPKTLSEHQKGF